MQVTLLLLGWNWGLCKVVSRGWTGRWCLVLDMLEMSLLLLNEVENRRHMPVNFLSGALHLQHLRDEGGKNCDTLEWKAVAI